jgi:pyruvate dehydrogenase E2 component (dihydrolipoamide acetyltransferase)
MHEVLMPRIDVLMQSGKIVQWIKNEGESVSKSEPIVLIEAEKTTFEIEAQESGVIIKVLREQGEDVPVGEALALVGSLSEKIPDRYTKTSTSEHIVVKDRPSEQPTVSQEIRASPAARSFAREHGIDLATVEGTGRGGRIQVEDVERAFELLKATPSESVGAALRIKEKVTLGGIRKAVAERLSHSFHTSVPVLITTEVDFEALEDARKKFEPAVSVTAFLVKSVASSLRDHLILNSSLEGNVVTVYDDINIAVAIDTPEGLTAPVVFEPEHKSVAEISEDISHLKHKASSGRLTIQELTAGTFTVTNLGGQGIEIFAPIINPPQAAILAMGRASKKPVAVNDSVQIRSQATLSLIFDHRIIDGVPAAKFLAHVKQMLENPNHFIDGAKMRGAP